MAPPLGDTSDVRAGDAGVSVDDTSESAPRDMPAEILPDEATHSDPVPPTLFDSSDANVTPPVALRLQLPTVSPEAPWGTDEAGVVMAVVSPDGQVEKVRLIFPPKSVHEAMILSAIKTWRFRPAMKDGEAVRYRHLIPVSLPR